MHATRPAAAIVHIAAHPTAKHPRESFCTSTFLVRSISEFCPVNERASARSNTMAQSTGYFPGEKLNDHFRGLNLSK
uniref:Uncharacterized protein n=1 Tax=Cucumis melo TaxID=3656 RepID=A0A9I9CV12_CUCME